MAVGERGERVWEGVGELDTLGVSIAVRDSEEARLGDLVGVGGREPVLVAVADLLAELLPVGVGVRDTVRVGVAALAGVGVTEPV